MARSSYIYVVSIASSGVVLAGFTVKRECLSYLANQADNGADLSKWTVLRLRDNGTKMSEPAAPCFGADEFMRLG
jgi:hypothetical protein